MKKQFILISMIMSAFFESIAQQQNRNIIWVNGPSPTSHNWDKAKTSALSANYRINNINIFPYDNDRTAQTIPNWATTFNDNLENENKTDVLGIGHDAGGLILRYMDMLQSGNNLSAVILDGVPNQGGAIFTKLLSNTANAPSPAQDMIQQLLYLRTQAQSCSGCQMLEATQSWFNQFSASNIKAYYQQLRPDAPTITNLQTPNIPYAVIWGNESDDALTLTRLVGSKYDSGDIGADNAWVDCYRSEIDQRIESSNQKFLLATLKTAAMIAGSVAKFSALKSTSAAAVLEAVLNAAVNQLQARFDLEKEIREIFECEIIHQALNAKWNILIGPYSYHEETVTVPCVPCDGCDDDPDPQVVGYCYSVCTSDCDPVTHSYTFTATYAQYEPHDGLYTMTEQSLPGAAKTYEAKGINHFQEQFWEYSPVRSAFVDLFNGGAGVAFVVPK